MQRREDKTSRLRHIFLQSLANKKASWDSPQHAGGRHPQRGVFLLDLAQAVTRVSLKKKINHRQIKTQQAPHDPELSRLHSCHRNTKIKAECLQPLAGGWRLPRPGTGCCQVALPARQGEDALCHACTRHRFTEAGKGPRAGHTATCETESESGSCCPLNKTRAYKYEMPQTLAIYGGGGGPRLTAGPGLLNRRGRGLSRARGSHPASEGGGSVSPSVVGQRRQHMGGPPVVRAMEDKLGTKKKTQLSNYS